MYVTNQPPKANSAFHPSGVGKWVSAVTGKAKAGMVHSVSGWMWGVQVKLRFLEKACHTWASKRCVHNKAYATPRLCLSLPYSFMLFHWFNCLLLALWWIVRWWPTLTKMSWCSPTCRRTTTLTTSLTTSTSTNSSTAAATTLPLDPVIRHVLAWVTTYRVCVRQVMSNPLHLTPRTLL